MSADRELLELAAKAAGMDYLIWTPGAAPIVPGAHRINSQGFWNPLVDDGDALRLAVRLKLHIHVDNGYGTAARRPDKKWQGCQAHKYGGIEAATRRAIVRAAAEIGRAE